MTTLTRVSKNKPTDKQCELLRKLGHTGPIDRLDKGMASALIERLKQNPENHRPTDKQATLLQQLGYAGNIDELSATSASATIDGLINALKQARESIKGSADLRDLAGCYTDLRGTKEQEGPCPKCGGDNRFHCKADFWFCRQCYKIDNGLPHDAVAFVMWHDNVTEAQAIANLTDGVLVAPAGQATRIAPASKPAQTEAWRTAEWQRENVQLIQQAHGRLLDNADHEADTGRAYLQNRGLDPFTRKAFKLGFAMQWHSQLKRYEPAIVMPWYTINGILRGVRFRYLKQYQIGMKDDGRPLMSNKQTSVEGTGQFAGALFGSQSLGGCIPELSTLIIVEGEFNDMSIWQIAHASHCNVLSLGSESAHITPAMAAYAGKYARVLLWMDKGERAQAMRAALPNLTDDDLIQSLNGRDANDLLQVGELGGFLAFRRFLSARSRPEQERVLFDLQDGQAGADESTDEIIAYIAKTLGNSL